MLDGLSDSLSAADARLSWELWGLGLDFHESISRASHLFHPLLWAARWGRSQGPLAEALLVAAFYCLLKRSANNLRSGSMIVRCTHAN